MRRSYRVNRDYHFKYYIAQYRHSLWPFWITIKHTKMPHIGRQSWHRTREDAIETCHQHAKGERWKGNSDGIYPFYLGKL